MQIWKKSNFQFLWIWEESKERYIWPKLSKNRLKTIPYFQLKHTLASDRYEFKKKQRETKVFIRIAYDTYCWLCMLQNLKKTDGLSFKSQLMNSLLQRFFVLLTCTSLHAWTDCRLINDKVSLSCKGVVKTSKGNPIN